MRGFPHLNRVGHFEGLLPGGKGHCGPEAEADVVGDEGLDQVRGGSLAITIHRGQEDSFLALSMGKERHAHPSILLHTCSMP